MIPAARVRFLSFLFLRRLLCSVHVDPEPDQRRRKRSDPHALQRLDPEGCSNNVGAGSERRDTVQQCAGTRNAVMCRDTARSVDALADNAEPERGAIRADS